jgi:hypothetical protein
VELLDEKFQFVPGEADDPEDCLIRFERYLRDVNHLEGTFEAGFLNHFNKVLDMSFGVFEAFGGEGATFGFEHFSRRRKWHVCDDLK